jgi:ligand-binding sensor domain-containing protein
MKNTNILLFLIVFAISCNGQNSKNSPKETLKTTPTPHFYGIKPDNSLQVSEYIRRMLQDKNGNIWFGTNGDGIARFDGKTLVYFTLKDGFSGTAVRGIFEDKEGNMWFGTSGGVSKYDGKTFVNFTTKAGLDDNNVWSLYGDKAGNIWVGTERGVSKYNPSYKTDEKPFKHFQMPLPEVQNPQSVFSPKLVWGFLEDKKGNMWLGTDGLGVYKYEPSTKSFINFTEKDGLCNNTVSCILEDKNGNLWFGTRFGGVSRYDGKSFTNFTKNNGLSSNFIHTIIEDKTGHIWISALGGGICRYDSSTARRSDTLSASGKSFTNYAAKEGLTNLYVQSILEDKSGKLWFGSGAGLFRMIGNSFINVTKKDLLQ